MSSFLIAEGDFIGRFKINRMVGQGKDGRVFEAFDDITNRLVAIKISHSQEFSETQWKREIRTMGAVSGNPYIIQIHDIGTHLGLPYLVLEWMADGDVASFARQQGGTIPLKRALTIIRDACKGLSAIHQAGLIHGDIKPNNLLLTEKRLTKIGDFSRTRSTRINDSSEPNNAGTIGYVAPEVVRGFPQTQTTDIYSLGATLVAIATGSPSRLASVLSPSSTELAPSVKALVAACCANDPAERPANAGELLPMLEAILHSPDFNKIPRIIPIHTRWSRFGQIWGWAVGLMAACLLFGCVCLIALWFGISQFIKSITPRFIPKDHRGEIALLTNRSTYSDRISWTPSNATSEFKTDLIKDISFDFPPYAKLHIATSPEYVLMGTWNTNEISWDRTVALLKPKISLTSNIDSMDFVPMDENGHPLSGVELPKEKYHFSNIGEVLVLILQDPEQTWVFVGKDYPSMLHAAWSRQVAP